MQQNFFIIPIIRKVKISSVCSYWIVFSINKWRIWSKGVVIVNVYWNIISFHLPIRGYRYCFPFRIIKRFLKKIQRSLCRSFYKVKSPHPIWRHNKRQINYTIGRCFLYDTKTTASFFFISFKYCWIFPFIGFLLRKKLYCKKKQQIKLFFHF